MENNPLISVVIPVHNLDSFLDKCLSSIYSQSYTNWECIVINDCSTDNSESIAQNWCDKDSRFRYIYNATNQGVSSTRNTGIDSARGEYIVFVDADDWVECDFLKDFIPYLYDTEEKHRLVIQDIIKDYPSYTEKGCQKYQNEKLNLPSDFNKLLSNYRYTQGYPFNKLFKIDILNKYNIRFPINTFNEDEIFYLRYIKYVNEIFFLKRANYHYLQRKNSLSRTPNFTKCYNYLKYNIDINNEFKAMLNNNEKERLIAEKYARKIFNGIFKLMYRNSIYSNNYTQQERLIFLKKSREILLKNKNLYLPPSSLIQKIDIFLLKNNFIWLLDLSLMMRLQLNK